MKINSEPTARQILETVLSPQTAHDVIEHRRVKKCPITARAAKAIADQLALIAPSARDAAIDHWLNMGWRGFKAEWFFRSEAGQGVTGAAMRMIENGRQNPLLDHGHDKRLPAIQKH